ncbi:hypothetical protein [Persicirhabdus sediminis]|nr:hypothetical protein [Persicirhabdus sediminis]
MPFFSCNIDRRGQKIRAFIGTLCLLSAGLVHHFFEFYPVSTPLFLAGIFCLIEAARKWCLLRALKIKTPW